MSKPDNVFQQTGKHIKTGNPLRSNNASRAMAKTYENNPTLIAPTGTMASRVLSKWLFNYYW